jgi:hypothetical protein
MLMPLLWCFGAEQTKLQVWVEGFIKKYYSYVLKSIPKTLNK